MATESTFRLFLSHASRDKWVARCMVAAVEAKAKAAGARIEVFLDERSIEVGEDIADEIRQAIERCDELVVFLTPYSVGRP